MAASEGERTPSNGDHPSSRVTSKDETGIVGENGTDDPFTSPQYDTSPRRLQMASAIAESLLRIERGLDNNRNFPWHAEPLLTFEEQEHPIPALLKHAKQMFARPDTTLWGLIRPGSARPMDARIEVAIPMLVSVKMLDRLDRWCASTEKKSLAGGRDEITDEFMQLALALDSILLSVARGFPPRTNEFRSLTFRAEEIRLLARSLMVEKDESALSQASVRVDSIVAHVEEAAGTVAAGEVAAHYLMEAKTERNRYTLWVAILFVCSGAAVALSWFIVSRSSAAPGTAQEAARLALVVPVLGLAAYAARESAHHRGNETAARTAAVQLRTIRAFTDSMDAESRKDVMRALGLRLFASLPDVGKKVDEPSYGVTGELVQIVKSLANHDGKLAEKKQP
ncbi:hypothetical protein [Rugosimonospora africana]|uniref:Uncharacterized protein n=1 Tax=Rugosimonospora africana TaxID=556532 RepID=A0A8J3VX44_9ACTN|nr:hypothetical protein [Rugosimonospora africana]GIH21491.1 hypothetical protein Raf01_96630 [Rugosimonospora africana]